MKRRLLTPLHSAGTDIVQVIGAFLAIVSGIVAIWDWYDDTSGLPGHFYIAALLFAMGFVLARPLYKRLFESADQEQKVAQRAEEISNRQDDGVEQKSILRWVQDNLPTYSKAARAIYEKRRHDYLVGELRPADFDKIEAELRPQYQAMDELEPFLLNQISLIKNQKIRDAAEQIYQLDRHMAFLMPSTWDSETLYAGHTPSWISLDWEREFRAMIGKLLRGESIEIDELSDIDRDD